MTCQHFLPVSLCLTPSLPLNANWTAIHYYTNAPPSPANASLNCCLSALLLVQRQHLQIKTWSSHGFACVPYHSQPVHGGVRSQGHPHSPEPPICLAEICWRHLRDDPWVLCQRVHRTLQQHWWEHKFTTEPEMEGKLPFLDSCTTLNDDGSLDLTVYRKPTQTSIWTLTLTTISNTRGLLYEHSSTEQTAWSPNRSRKMLRSDMSSPHSKPMPTRTGSLRSPHPKTTPTPRVTPQGARPAPAWASFIGTSKKLARIFKNRRGLPQALQHTALHPGPPQRQDTWSQKVWCRLWNPVSRMPCPVCRWNCPHTGDKDERPPKTEVSTNSCGRTWTSHQNGRCQSDSPWGQYVATQDPWVHRNQDPAINLNQGYELPPPDKVSISWANNKHAYRQSQVRMPKGSGVEWAECSLIIGTGCRVKVFSLILDSSVGLWAFSLWRFGVWGFPASTPAFRRGRQLVSIRFEKGVPVQEHRN